MHIQILLGSIIFFHFGCHITLVTVMVSGGLAQHNETMSFSKLFIINSHRVPVTLYLYAPNKCSKQMAAEVYKYGLFKQLTSAGISEGVSPEPIRIMTYQQEHSSASSS